MDGTIILPPNKGTGSCDCEIDGAFAVQCGITVRESVGSERACLFARQTTVSAILFVVAAHFVLRAKAVRV